MRPASGLGPGIRGSRSGLCASGEPSVTEGRPGEALLRLVAVMDTLRIACPWDARQTHESLAPHLLEECYEALDALESGDPAALRDELGDVLLQVVFHARIAAEATDGTGYTIDDVAEGIVAKLIRRHPHVFADVTVSGPEEVKRNWDAIKAEERAEAAGRPARCSTQSPLASQPSRWPASSSAAPSGRGHPRTSPACRSRRAGPPRGGGRPGGAGRSRGAGRTRVTGSPGKHRQARETGRPSAPSAPSCSRWWR